MSVLVIAIWLAVQLPAGLLLGRILQARKPVLIRIAETARRNGPWDRR